MIHEYVEKGAYLIDIAAALGVHPRTVRRALRRGGPPAGKRPRARHSKLDPYQPTVDRLLQEGIWNAVVIWREIAALGYTGRSSILRAYIRPKRALRPSRATVRFETAPGQQLQHDGTAVWTGVAGARQKVYGAVNTLGYSRRFHGGAAPRADAEHTYESLIRAFEWFGGTPTAVLVDHQKAAVIAHRLGDQVRYHPRFLDLAGHYRFRPRACRPYRARTKGKDERMVRYLKEHFLVRYRAFDSLAHLNQPLEQWWVNEADQRVHGTVKEVVAVRFQREQPHLQPLPAHRFDTSYLEPRMVAGDGYIDVRGNRYRVPATLCGQAVTVRLTLDGQVSIGDRDGQCVAVHSYRPAAHGWSTVPAHQTEVWLPAVVVERRDLAVYDEVTACSK